MKKTLILLISLILCMSFVLGSCDNGSNDDDLFATTNGNQTQKKTEATTAGKEDVEIPTNLRPVIDEENQIVGRLVNKPITVEIWDGVTIDLDYQGWPTVCKGEDGVLYATSSLRISHIDPFGAIAFYESHDNGETWSDARIIVDTSLDDRDTGVVYLGNGKILVNWFAHNTSNYFEIEDYMQWQKNKKVTTAHINATRQRMEEEDPIKHMGGSFVIISDDYGQTWSEPSRVPVKAPHGPSLSQDGKTLYFFGAPAANHQLATGGTKLEGGYFYLYISRDFGKTWQQRGKVKLPTSLQASIFDEGYCIQLQDGSFIAGIRTGEGKVIDHWTICVTTSRDGVNWSDPKPVTGPDNADILNGSPPHFLQLKNGVILLAYTCRNSKMCGSRGRLSYDGGETWTEEFIICVSDQPTKGDLGYPSTVELADGTLYTTTYQAYGDDPCPSLLYTKWHLESAGE